MEKSLVVKTYSHPLEEQLKEINTVEELQEIVLEIMKSFRNCEEKEALEKSQELGDYRSHIDLLYTKQGTQRFFENKETISLDQF